MEATGAGAEGGRRDWGVLGVAVHIAEHYGWGSSGITAV